MVVKAVFLDFGGTLASGEMDWQEFHVGVLSIINSYGFSIELGQLKKAIRSALNRLERIRARGKENTLEEVYGHALKKLGLPSNEVILNMIHDLFKEQYISIFFSCIEDVLEKLSQRYKLALISNTMSDQPKLMLEEADFAKFFELIVCSRDLGIRKPNSKIFKYVLEKLDVKPSEVIHVGDNVEADMRGAENVGITPIWIKNPEETPWYGYAISTICDLPEYLLKIESVH